MNWISVVISGISGSNYYDSLLLKAHSPAGSWILAYKGNISFFLSDLLIIGLDVKLRCCGCCSQEFDLIIIQLVIRGTWGTSDLRPWKIIMKEFLLTDWLLPCFDLSNSSQIKINRAVFSVSAESLNIKHCGHSNRLTK